MKKIIIVIMCVFGIATAYAANENAATSKEYVDTELVTKQPTIPAEGANVVMIFDSTADNGIGTKNIYDESASYASQQDALVTAGTANAAVQMAINGEFECILYDPDNPTDCWWWNIKSANQQRLPAGYTELEYIASTGTQYINTGILPNQNYSMELDFQPTVALQRVFFAATRESAQNKAFTINSGESGTLLYCSFDGSGNRTIMNWTDTSTDRRRVKISSDKCVDGETIIPLTTSEFQATLPLYLFAGNDNGEFRLPAKIRVFSFKVWNNNVPVADYIPAKNDSDGEIGMYDTVTNTFFTNAGTGTFIAGPVASYIPQNQ